MCILLLFITGCWKENMGLQPKAKPMRASAFFSNGTSARPLVLGAVARGDDWDMHLNQGLVAGKLATTFPDHYPSIEDGPFPMRGPELREILRRGQEQYTIFCSMCHGDAGDGHGIIVRRGFIVPPSYHIDRLRQAPVGHFFDVITNGYNAMYSYGDRVPVADRWAIVAYIRALQMSQAIDARELSSSDLRQLPVK